MATINGTTNNSLWTYKLEVNEDSYSIDNNTSDVTVRVYIGRASSRSYIGGSWTGTVVVDGTTHNISGTIPYPTYIDGGAWYQIASTSYSGIPHGGDGSKTIGVSSTMSSSAFTPSYCSASGNVSLTTIPRASEISSVSTVNIGSNPTITVNRKSSSFTHTITYSFGSLSGTVVSKSSNTSITSWTIPSSFYGQIPNSKTGTGTLTITTYNGNTQVGSSNTKSFSVSTNESSCKPTVSGSVVDSNATTKALTQNNSILIAGYSTASVSYSATPKNSASIKTITVNNSSAYSGTSSSVVSGTKTITKFNASTINIVANDSRTYSNTKTLKAGTDYTLVNYIPVTFNGTVTRKSPTEDILLLSFSGNYFNGNLGATSNVLTLTWKWRVKGTSSWQNGGTLVNGTDFTINASKNTYSSGSGSSQTNITLGSNFDYQTTYEIGIFYEDKLVKDQSVIIDGLKGIPIVNWTGDFFNINGEIRQYGNPYKSYCKIRTNFEYKTVNSDNTTLTGWEEVFRNGDIRLESNKIKVTNTSCLRLSGQISGYGNTWVRYVICERNGSSETEIDDSGMGALYQLGRIGNGFWSAPLPNVIVSLDRTKTYSVYLSVSPYNGYSMEVNNGFGSRGTYICAEKIN